MTEWICCFYGCLTTYKNWISQLISFVRYSILKNPAFWLISRFLDHYSRTRFFPNMWFLQKVRILAVLSCSSKKGFNELDFCENPQNIIFGLFFFLTSRALLTPTIIFFQKSDFITFLSLWLTSWKKSEKTDDPILRSCVAKEPTDGRTELARVSKNGTPSLKMNFQCFSWTF